MNPVRPPCGNSRIETFRPACTACLMAAMAWVTAWPASALVMTPLL